MNQTSVLATATGSVEDDVRLFSEQGFLVVPGLIAGEELARLQEETMVQIEAGPDRDPPGHFKKGVAPDGNEVFFRIEAIATKTMENDWPWLTMAHPRILELVKGILGEFVCWADALLFKGTEGGAGVPMHCGHSWDLPLGHENLVVDVYLDRATPETGCLKVVPGSNHLSRAEAKDALALGFDVPGLLDVELEPGDVLFHSEWMLHGSLPTPPLGRPSRRILYYAFRSPAALLSDGMGLDREKIAACIRRLQIAQERRERVDTSPALEIVPSGWEQDVADVDDSLVWQVGAAY